MPVLKQHRNAKLELNGRRLQGSIDVSLTNQIDREALMQWMAEARKQLQEFDPKKAPRNKPKPVPARRNAKADAARKKKPVKAKRKVKK